MRTHIAKNLQKRCKTIRVAVKEYNTAAAALDPPGKVLDWDNVSHYSFLEEFPLLKDTRNDIAAKKWAQPLVREMIRTARRIDRAKEELERVHREAHRVHTSIQDEEAHFSSVLARLEAREDPAYLAVLEYCSRRRATNSHVLAHLQRLFELQGYAGKTSPGTHAGAPRECLPEDDARGADSSPDAGATTAVPSSPAHAEAALEATTLPDVIQMAAQEKEWVDEEDEDEDEDGGDEGAEIAAGLYDHLTSIAAVM